MSSGDLRNFKFIKPGEVRTRFAPSPTGPFHIGNARAALFNYIFAKQLQGNFILRIENTDTERSKPEYERDVLESLKWLSLNWDEGPEIGGNYGPYRQSERLEIYEKYILRLIEEKKAYYCFCSEEELEAQKQYRLSRGEPPKYSGKCQNLTKNEIEKNLKEKKSSVIRFKTPPKKIKFKDLIREDLEFDMELAGDIVIAKNTRYPLFILAGVIDDFEMKISHIIRGEDHLSNTPKQILLQEALDFPRPEYAHLPLILGQDRAKLSKRHGAVAIAEYKNEGYLPETLINFIAFLGWNPGTEREIYSMNSLIKEFALERVQKGGASFNVKRLDFLNGFYIRQKSIERLTEICLPYLIQDGLIKPSFKAEQYPPAYGAMEISQIYKISETKEEININSLQRIISLYQERLKKLSEISQLTAFFFKKNLEYDKELLGWANMTDQELKSSLDKAEELLVQIKEEDWTKENLENILIYEAEKQGEGDRGKLLWPLRVALTGQKASAGPFEIAEILGKEKTLVRIKEAQKKF